MTISAENRSGRGAYLIVLKDPLVAQDLAESIADFDGTAKVIVRRALADAAAALAAVDRVEVAFVCTRLDQLAASPLTQMIRDRGGRLVLMGDEAEDRGEAQGWTVLHRPFSQGVVTSHLMGTADGGGGAWRAGACLPPHSAGNCPSCPQVPDAGGQGRNPIA